MALVKIGFVSAEAKELLKKGLTWVEITQKATGAENAKKGSFLRAEIV